MTKRARILSDENIMQSLEYIQNYSSHPDRDRLFILLSCFLGLRAQEIARLDAEDVLDAQNRIGNYLQVTKKAGKYGKERRLPLSKALREEIAWYLGCHQIIAGPMFWTQYRTPCTPSSVQQQISGVYKACGLTGASSHSGRRTLLTQLARVANKYGGSLRDVQFIAGHADITTTEAYIEFSETQHEMLLAVWQDLEADAQTPLRHRSGNTLRKSQATLKFARPSADLPLLSAPERAASLIGQLPDPAVTASKAGPQRSRFKGHWSTRNTDRRRWMRPGDPVV